MRTVLALALLSLSCTKAPESWPITEDDEYAVYQAILDSSSIAKLVGAGAQPMTSAEDVSQLGPKELEGFDLIAFDSFRRSNATPLKIDPTRLHRKGDSPMKESERERPPRVEHCAPPGIPHLSELL